MIQSQSSENRLKILMLADSYLPHAGGSRVYYHNLLKGLVAQSRDQVTVLTKKVPGWEEFDRRESSESLRILRRSTPLPNFKVQQYPKVFPPLASAIRQVLQRRADLVHVGDLFPQGIIGLLLKRFLGTPYLAFCHAEEITQTENYRYQPILRNRIFREADAVVAACEFAKVQLLRLGVPEERIHKINPGVDWKRFAPQPPSAELIRQHSLQGKKVLLTVSRLWPRKGHDVVIKAISKIAGEIPDLRYLIAGRGPEEARLRQLATDLGLNDVVKFLGFVPEEDLPGLYNLCDLFVMPNREEDGDVEGFGMVFLEANAAGKAVVAGRSGGTTDSVLDGVTGLLVNPEDIDELAAKLRTLMLDRTFREKLGETGLLRAKTEFDWGTRARTLREVSSQVVSRARASKTRTLEPALPMLSHKKDQHL